jgi:hypothetical protein
MSFVAVAIGGSALIGGITSAAIGANAAGNAASEQEQASQNALQFQQQTLATNEANAKPYQAAGTEALSTLESDLPNLTQGFSPTAAGLPSTFSYNAGDFTADPGYAFAVQQGNKAIENSAAARGGDVSGGALKSLDSYDVGMADQDYGNAYNRALGTYQQNYSNAENTFYNNENNAFSKLGSVVNTGLGANATVAGTSENFANNASNIAIGEGNAAAAGTVGTANAINTGITGATSTTANSILLNQLLNGSAPAVGNNSSYTNQFANQANNPNNAPISPAQWASYDATAIPN